MLPIEMSEMELFFMLLICYRDSKLYYICFFSLHSSLPYFLPLLHICCHYYHHCNMTRSHMIWHLFPWSMYFAFIDYSNIFHKCQLTTLYYHRCNMTRSHMIWHLFPWSMYFASIYYSHIFHKCHFTTLHMFSIH